jgi:hypothetical protein
MRLACLPCEDWAELTAFDGVEEQAALGAVFWSG